MASKKWMTFVQRLVNSNSVVVFSKSFWPFAARAKDILRDTGVKSLHVQELDHHENGEEVQSALTEITGRTTVPQVFVNGKFIGGGDETSSLHQSGKLTEMLFGKKPQ